VSSNVNEPLWVILKIFTI